MNRGGRVRQPINGEIKNIFDYTFAWRLVFRNDIEISSNLRLLSPILVFLFPIVCIYRTRVSLNRRSFVEASSLKSHKESADRFSKLLFIAPCAHLADIYLNKTAFLNKILAREKRKSARRRNMKANLEEDYANVLFLVSLKGEREAMNRHICE